MFLQSAWLVKGWWVVTETKVNESSLVDDSSQNLRFTSRQRLTTRHKIYNQRVFFQFLLTTRHTLTSRHRNIYSRVVKGGRLVTVTFVHESWHMHDSSHTQAPSRHAIYSPYSNYTCIFLYISPLFYLLVYLFLCFSIINKFVLFYFLSKYMQTF